MKRIIVMLTVVMLLSACGGSSMYSLPSGVDHSLRLVQSGDPHDVLAASQDKGHTTMQVGESLSFATIYRFRSAFGDKEKDEYVSADAVYSWLEPVNDKLTLNGTTVTAVKAGLDTLKASYYNDDEALWVDCKLEITVEP